MIKKAIRIMFFVLILIIMLTVNTQAAPTISVNDININDYKPTQTLVTSADRLMEIANNIVGAVKVIGSMVSVVALIGIGIKYMFGSVEEKAEYKKTLKPYLIGAIMVFGITNLLDVFVGVIKLFY